MGLGGFSETLEWDELDETDCRLSTLPVDELL